MSKSVTTLRRVSREDAKILALYLYRLSAELVSSKSYSECQMLLDSLIAKLNLKDHADRVLKAFIKRLIAQRKLTPKKHARMTPIPLTQEKNWKWNSMRTMTYTVHAAYS